MWEIKCCGNCRYAKSDKDDLCDYICTNWDGENCGGWMDADYCCTDWKDKYES